MGRCAITKRFLNGDLPKKCFHLHWFCIAGNPKVQKLKMFCFSAALWGCFVLLILRQMCFCSDCIIAKLSLLCFKDSQMFVNLSSSLWIHPFFCCSFLCGFYHTPFERLVGSREDIFMRLVISRYIEHGLAPGMSSWTQVWLANLANYPSLGSPSSFGKGFLWIFPWHHQTISNPSLIDLTSEQNPTRKVDETHSWCSNCHSQFPMQFFHNDMSPKHTTPGLAFCHNDQPQKVCARHVSAVNATRHLRFVLQALEDTRTISRSFGW